MKLSNEFVVAAPIEQTWKTLLDVPAGGWRGKVGDYAGTARVQDIDDDERVASFRAVTGDGVAAATVTSRLAPDEGATRVLVETDLRASGPVDQAQVEAALEELSKRLEREALAEPDRTDPGVRAGGTDPLLAVPGQPDPGPVDPGPVDPGPVDPDRTGGQADPDRTALVGIAVLLALLIAAIVRGGRR
jgi:carbon monoxide dehydrogenase subunit G